MGTREGPGHTYLLSAQKLDADLAPLQGQTWAVGSAWGMCGPPRSLCQAASRLSVGLREDCEASVSTEHSMALPGQTILFRLFGL